MKRAFSEIQQNKNHNCTLEKWALAALQEIYLSDNGLEVFRTGEVDFRAEFDDGDVVEEGAVVVFFMRPRLCHAMFRDRVHLGVVEQVVVTQPDQCPGVDRWRLRAALRSRAHSLYNHNTHLTLIWNIAQMQRKLTQKCY